MVSVRFSYTEPEYVAAMKLHYRELLNVPLDLVVSALFVLGAVAHFVFFGLSFLVLLPVFGAVILLGMVFLGLVVLPRFLFRREPKLKESYELYFADSGIKFRTDKINSDIKWELYNRVLQDEKSYLLYHGPISCTVIPVSAFQSESDRAVFERLLNEKIRNVRRR